jgi:tetratricopeptide (TPR) repeat protein
LLNPATAVKQLEFAWSGLGIATGTPVDLEAAKTFYQKQLKEARVVKDQNATTWALASLGHILIRMKDFKDARRYVSESLELADELHDYAALGYVNNLLGDIAYGQGLMEDANLFYRRGWDAYARIGEEKGQAWSYTNIGNAAQAMGDFNTASQMYRKSIELIEKMDDPRALAWNKNLMGSVGWAIGSYEVALKTYEEALELYRLKDDMRGQAWTLDLMGNLKLAMHQDVEAERLYHQAHTMSGAEGTDPQGMAWYRYHMGAVYLFRKNVDEAKEEFTKALQIFEHLQDTLGQVASLTHLGEIACTQGKFKEAQSQLKHGVQLMLAGQSNPLLVDLLTSVAQLLKGQGEEKKAISLLMVALSHPTCRQQTKDRMVSLAKELQTDFTPSEVDKGFRWAKGADLEEMANGWLVSLGMGTEPKEKEKRIKTKKPQAKKTSVKAVKKAKPKTKRKK